MATASVWLLAALGSAPVEAQGLYRIVGPDGRVTFTDRPPAAAEASPVRAAPSTAAANPALAGLPSALAAVAGRFPVALYTNPDCGPPCAEARAFLRERGVPFTERTVVTATDADELQRLTGARLVPSATVGRQALVGLKPAEWTGYLDAAGYPPTSRLPANWRAPAPTPLTQPPSPVAGTGAAPAAGAAGPAQPVPTPSGPGGIRF